MTVQFKMQSKCTFSQKFHFALDTHKLKLFRWSVAIVEEKLLSRLYSTFSKNSNAMIAVNHHDLCVAIGIDRMVCEANFISLPCSVNNEIIVQIEQKTAHVLVVDLSATICLILGYNFPTILRNELIFLCTFFKENTPARNIRWGH